MKIRLISKLILDTLFPQSCLGCGKEGSLVCSDCLSLIEITESQFCPFCSKGTPVFGHGTCPDHREKNLSGLFSATSYQNILVKKLISKFKYKPFLKKLSHPLASLIIAHFLISENKLIWENRENSIFVPIPLRGSKKRNRGFNQAALIAEELSGFFKIPVRENNLQKIKKTQPQVKLKREEREKNVHGAFKLKNPQQVRGKRIFLVDDVFTTGSTMEECARVLRGAGASEVWGITVAREPLSN